VSSGLERKGAGGYQSGVSMSSVYLPNFRVGVDGM